MEQLDNAKHISEGAGSNTKRVSEILLQRMGRILPFLVFFGQVCIRLMHFFFIIEKWSVGSLDQLQLAHKFELGVPCSHINTSC